MDHQQREFIEQFNKLTTAFGKNEYGRCRDILLQLDKIKSSMESQRGFMEQFNKLKTAFGKMEYGRCSVILPQLEKGLSKIFPPLDPQFDPYESLEDHDELGFNQALNDITGVNVPLVVPTAAEPTATETVMDEEGIKEKLCQSRLWVKDAFDMVGKAVQPSLKTATQNHLKACQDEIEIAMNSLFKATLLLTKAAIAQSD